MGEAEEEEAACWKVVVCLLSGEQAAELSVSRRSTVASLREDLVEESGIRGHLQLVFRGVALAEELTLAEAGLSDNAMVTAIRTAGLRLAAKHDRSGPGAACVWSLDPGKSSQQLLSTFHRRVSGAVQSLAISPDGERVAIGSVESYPGNEDATVSLWSVKTGQCDMVTPAATTTVYCVAFSHDSRTLAWGSSNRSARQHVATLWRAGDAAFEQGRLLAVLDGHDDVVYALSFSPCGQRLLTGSCDGTAKVWSLETREVLGVFAGHDDAVLWAGWSPDGLLAASTSEDGAALLWSTADFQLVARLSGHFDRICGAAFSRDGTRLVTGSSDRTAKVWEVPAGHCLRTIECGEEDVCSVAFMPDTAFVVTGSDEAIKVWSVESKACVAHLLGEMPMAVALEA